MDSFDKYDEVDYTGKSDPDIWETHLEFFFSKQTALRRYAEIKLLHPEAAKKTAVRPFFLPTGEIEIHPDMIKDFGSVNPDTAKGVWQFEYWLPSTEKKATEYEKRMSARDPEGWAEHRQREKRQMYNPTAESPRNRRRMVGHASWPIGASLFRTRETAVRIIQDSKKLVAESQGLIGTARKTQEQAGQVAAQILAKRNVRKGGSKS